MLNTKLIIIYFFNKVIFNLYFFRCDKILASEVAETELQKFEEKHHKRVLRIRGSINQSDELSTIAPVLNYICNQLWQRDQELLAVK